MASIFSRNQSWFTSLRYLFLFGFLLVMGFGQTSFAQQEPTEPFRPFATAQNDWSSTLDEYEAAERANTTTANVDKRATLNEIKREAEAYRQDARTQIQYYDRLLAALAPPATTAANATEIEEPQAVLDRRAEIKQERDDYYTREKLSSLAITRADLLLVTNVLGQQEQRIESLLNRRPSVLNYTYWQEVGDDLRKIFTGTFNSSHGNPADQPLTMLMIAFWLLAQAAAYVFVFFSAHKFVMRYFKRVEMRHPALPVNVWLKLSTRILHILVNGILAIVIWLIFVWLIRLLSLPSFDVAIIQMPIIRAYFGNVNFSSSYLMNIVLYATLCYVMLRAVLAPRNTHWGLLVMDIARAKLVTYKLPVLFLVSFFLYRFQANLDSTQLSAATTSLLMTVGLLFFVYYVNRQRKRFLSFRKEEAVKHKRGEIEVLRSGDIQEGALKWMTDFSTRLMFGLSLLMVFTAITGYHNLSIRVAIGISLTAILLIMLLAMKAIIMSLIEQFSHFIRKETEPDGDSDDHSLLTPAASNTLDEEETEAAPDLMVLMSRIVVNVIVIVIFASLALLIWGLPYEQLESWVTRVLAGVEFGGTTISLQKIILGIGILIGGVALAKFIKRSIIKSDSLSLATSEGVRFSIGTILQYVFIVISFLVSVSFMGLNLASFSLFAGALGIGIGFGLQSIVQNFVSGLILLVQRPLEVGDWVSISNSSGIVKRVNLMNTELQTFQRANVIIPNSDVMSATFTNMTRGDKQGRIEVPVGVAYGTDTSKVEKLLIQCARRHPLVANNEPIMALFMGFGDSSLDFELRCFTNDTFSSLRIGSELRFAINQTFEENGIEIPFPQRVVHGIGDSNREEPNDEPPAQESTQS